MKGVYKMRKINFILLLLLFQIIPGIITNTHASNRLVQRVDKSFFIENKGQWDEEVLFLAKIGGMNAWITKTGVVYDFYKLEAKSTKKPKPKAARNSLAN